MRLSRALVPVCVLFLLTPVAFAADAPAPGGHHWRLDFLTHEERMILFAETRAKTAGMTREQRREFRRQQRAKFEAMPQADKRKLAAALKAKWDGLTPEQQAKMKADAAAFRAAHPRHRPPHAD